MNNIIELNSLTQEKLQPVLLDIEYNCWSLSPILLTQQTFWKTAKIGEPLNIDDLNKALYKACLNFKGEYIELKVDNELKTGKAPKEHTPKNISTDVLNVCWYEITEVRQAEPVARIIMDFNKPDISPVLEVFESMYKDSERNYIGEGLNKIPFVAYNTDWENDEE